MLVRNALLIKRFDNVCELFGETIRIIMFECGCYFVVKCYGCVWVELLCLIYRVWSSK